MSKPCLFLDRASHSKPVKALFEKSIRSDSDEVNRIRVLLEELFWDHTVQFKARDFVGYYQIDRLSRTISGLWPVNDEELAYLLLNLSTLVFEGVDLPTAMQWVRQLGAYHRLIDQGAWRVACNVVEKAVQSTLATESNT